MLDVGAHPDAGIGHLHHDVVARGRSVVLALDVVVVDKINAQGQLAPLGHGIRSIDIQIEKNLFHLPRVGFHDKGACRWIEIDGDLLTGSAESFRRFFNMACQIHGLNLIVALAGVSQQLAGEPGPALDLLFDVQQPFGRGVSGIDFHFHQGKVSLDNRKQIVEVVCNSTGQGSDGLHFLGMLQLVFKEFFF